MKANSIIAVIATKPAKKEERRGVPPSSRSNQNKKIMIMIMVMLPKLNAQKVQAALNLSKTGR